ncbi:hypothetical protein [Thermincola potens]|uniref:DUF8042 domain-containing protein n=1 Tax=Thermincola potens (strain JR) TaxID=635013 RepID=D5XCU5_THEPJ|nr:hypothetical protein [Thermincola potens]ADG83621.1 conserved hypothetical protein [Thermincola potens JR]
MKLYIDGKEVQWSGQDIDSFWQAVNKELQPNQRVVVEVKCDGLEVNNEALEDCIKNGVGQIEIFSNTPAELIFDGLAYAVEYLPRLIQGLGKVVQLIQEGEEGEAVRLFLPALEGIEWLNSLLTAIETFGIQKEVTDAIKQKIPEIIHDFKSQMETLLAAWENFDYLLVADILEYEVIPLLEELKSIVEMVELCQ